jgi:prolyl-tRNA editing enzyme YbaK/EbsC (Cys-tRNA(Pro) deacylase)
MIFAAKFDAELLRDLIHGLRPAASRLPRKRFHFQLADEEVSNKLSGFSHNAVSPFGMVSDIPIVICRRCTEVQPAYLFMGGGEVDLKLGISVSDFLRATNAIVGELSTPRALSADSVVDDD